MKLSIQLNGAPAHIYRFVQGSYENKHVFVCAHLEQLSDEEALARVLWKIPGLPSEVDFDERIDLFQQALGLAGFVPIEGLWVPVSHASLPACDREYLNKAVLMALADARKRKKHEKRQAPKHP